MQKGGCFKDSRAIQIKLQKVYPAADIVINVNEDKRIDFGSDSEPRNFDNDVVTAWENALSGSGAIMAAKDKILRKIHHAA